MVEGDGRILSAHYAVDDAPVANWRGAFYDDLDPTPLLDAIENGAMVCAHNARFDRRVWNAWRKPHWPTIRVEKTVDSATMCRLINWPAALGKAAARLGGEKLPNVTYRKLWDMRHPMGEVDRPLFDQMVRYGDQDVVEMRRLFNTLPKLSPELQQEWIASELVNDRGFLVDLGWAKDAATLFKSCTLDSGDQVRVLTRGLVPTVKSSAALLAWLELHVGRRLTRPVKVRIGGGRAGFRTEVKATADKSARASLREWLLTNDEAPVRATPTVLEVMDAIDDAAGAAGSKYQAALDRCSGDGRLRGSYIMHGASQTGRFTAGGMQPHNLIRHKSKDPILERNECIAAPSTAAIGKLLRSTIIAPPGRKLVWCDWSAIEARITPWLAIGPDTPAAERASAEAVLKIFFDGGDAYLHAASGIYGRPIGKKDIERQHGKVAVLALGFGGSVGALANMARAYATELPDPAGIVKGYREANPWILWLCRKVEEAAFDAVRNHGQVFGAGKLQLVASHATLALVLPDGSALHYPNPRIEMVDRFGKDDGEEQPTVTFDHPAFGRAAFSGPVCTENPTQAVAARILRRALVLHERQHQADPRVGPIVMHTHDEMVAECDEADLELTYAALERSMSTFEPWADGLPMAAEAGYGRFYQTEEKSDD